MIYAIMFIATGACTIDRYDERYGDDQDEGLAMGSMAIITGTVMIADLLILIVRIFKKEDE